MSQSGAVVSEDCITAFNDLKLSKKYKYIIYKLTDDYKQIVIEEASNDKQWDNFRKKLTDATSKSKTVSSSHAAFRRKLVAMSLPRTDEQSLSTTQGAVGKGHRYAVYDFEYNLATGEGVRNKIVFIAWSPDEAGVLAKMTYASSKEALKRSLNGLASELQANDSDAIEYETVIKTVSKGLAAP